MLFLLEETNDAGEVASRTSEVGSTDVASDG